MVQKRSVIAGIFLGVLILIFGLILIFAHGWVWSWFEILYSMLGIQSQPSRFWGMFISTIGLAAVAVGVFLIWSMGRGWTKDGPSSGNPD